MSTTDTSVMAEIEQIEEEQQESIEAEIAVGETDMSELSEATTAAAESMIVSDFKCPSCGLAHGHDTDKHRSSDSFNISHEEASDMNMNPNGHCGLHDIAENGKEYGFSDSDVERAQRKRGNAPIPEHVKQQL